MPAETKIQTQAEVEENMVDLPNSGSWSLMFATPLTT